VSQERFELLPDAGIALVPADAAEDVRREEDVVRSEPSPGLGEEALSIRWTRLSSVEGRAYASPGVSGKRT
jgi:hypothetical protein